MDKGAVKDITAPRDLPSPRARRRRRKRPAHFSARSPTSPVPSPCSTQGPACAGLIPVNPF